MSTRYDPPVATTGQDNNDDDLFDVLADENVAGESAAKLVMADHHNQTSKQQQEQPEPFLSDMTWPILPDPQSFFSTIVRPDALVEKGFDMVGAMLGDAPKMILSDHGPGSQSRKSVSAGSTRNSKSLNNTKSIGVPTPYDPEKSVVPIDDCSRIVQQQQQGGCVGLTWKAATSSSGIPMYNCQADRSVEMTLTSGGDDDGDEEEDDDDYTEDDSTISSFRPPPAHITLNMDDPLMQQQLLMEQQAKMLQRKKRRSGSPLLRRIGSSLRYGMTNNKAKKPNKVRSPVANELSVEEWLKMNADKFNPKKTGKSRSKSRSKQIETPSIQEQIDQVTGGLSKGKKGSQGTSKECKTNPDTPSTGSKEARTMNKTEARKKKREGVKEKKLLQKQMKEQKKSQKKSKDTQQSPKTKAPVYETVTAKVTSKHLVGKPMQSTGRGRSMIPRESDPTNVRSSSLERIPDDELQRRRSRSMDRRRTLPPHGHQQNARNALQSQTQPSHDVPRGRSRSLERRQYYPQEPELFRGSSKSMERRFPPDEMEFMGSKGVPVQGRPRRHAQACVPVQGRPRRHAQAFEQRDHPTGQRDRSRSLSRRETGLDGYYDDVHRGRSRSLERQDRPAQRGQSQSMQQSLMYEYERLQQEPVEYIMDQPQKGKSRTKQSGEIKRGKSKGRVERQQSAPAPSKNNQRKPIQSKKSRPVRGRE
jgi:hypothetical protein